MKFHVEFSILLRFDMDKIGFHLRLKEIYNQFVDTSYLVVLKLILLIVNKKLSSTYMEKDEDLIHKIHHNLIVTSIQKLKVKIFKIETLHKDIPKLMTRYVVIVELDRVRWIVLRGDDNYNCSKRVEK